MLCVQAVCVVCDATCAGLHVCRLQAQINLFKIPKSVVTINKKCLIHVLNLTIKVSDPVFKPFQT